MRASTTPAQVAETEIDKRYAAVQDPRDHLGLVYREATKLGRAFERDPCEFVGPAYISMTHAVRTWNANKGASFSSHAIPALKFRTYDTVMRELGCQRNWHTKKHRSRPVRISTKHDRELATHHNVGERIENSERISENKRTYQDVISASHLVCPIHGPSIMHMIAQGMTYVAISRELGKNERYVRCLMAKVRTAIAMRATKTIHSETPELPETPVVIEVPETAVDKILSIVCELFGTTPEIVRGITRGKQTVRARRFLSYVCNRELHISFPHISAQLKRVSGGHSTFVEGTQLLIKSFESGELFSVLLDGSDAHLDGPRLISIILDKYEARITE